MEKIAQQVELTQVETNKRQDLSSSFVESKQPQVIPLDVLDFVGGGDGEGTSAPVKGW